MKNELAKTYEPALFEDDIYHLWEDSGFFNPDNLDLPANAPSYTIVLPPPNITAKLHLGHSAMLAIEDLMVRYRRQNSYRTLWLPGTDHAAIATQNMVEKKIFSETGKTRHDLGREAFLEEVNKFVAETQATILRQTRKMGASLDWSRLAFTLDEPRQQAVQRMFLDMYKEGVIYRGERIVNWCPRCHSTLADDEVEYKEQKAFLYTFKYSPDFPIAISTTRPETKLGDTAVAVNPKDERYRQYIGQEYQLDFCGQALKIKIIADYNVEMDFGTGALGVTPAHSAVDWQMAEAQSLPKIKVIDEDGLIREGFGKFSGLSAIDAREKVVASLRNQGLMIGEEEIVNNLSCCYRCDSPIEPLPSKQWFIAVDKPLSRLNGKSLKTAAIAAASGGEITFLPERFNKRYLDWMENLHDWCISRQIWFGHSIPAWYRDEEIYVGEEAPNGEGWIKDGDTLDTWFSSGMWTFSTLGWPDNFKNGVKSGDLARFHPTQVLETGYEILTLWVSRMVMMSFFALGEKPFSQVYLHGTILDKAGKKMSKSKGNGVDPLEVIAKYGADAVRLSLLMGATPGNDSRYSEEKIEAKRNFINKLWNISRFILSDLDDRFLSAPLDVLPEAKTLADSWILNELFSARSIVDSALSESNFSIAAEALYDFTWNKLADWYLEAAKVEKGKEEILVFVLKNLLIMWHPFIPYVTEAIWQSFNEGLLMVEQWPSWPEKIEGAADEPGNDFKVVQEIIVAIRNARSENKVEPARKLQALAFGPKSELLLAQASLIKGLRTGIESLLKTDAPPTEAAIKVVLGDTDIYLLGAVDPEKEKARLQKEAENLLGLIGSLKSRLENQEFIGRAPANIVQAEKDKLERYETELAKIQASLAS
ncbi:MAG: valine--tRNA ligase [Patescibacteria group bacterium]|nr:valine--tRNA ligase [Patescibacteria group bacterium]